MWYVDVTDLSLEEGMDNLLNKFIEVIQIDKESITVAVDLDGDVINYKILIKWAQE